MTEQIPNAVKLAIFPVQPQPGQRLVEQAIAKEHNVVQNAVREALVSLAHQGFVKRVANRATFVTKMSLEDAEQLSVVREAAERLDRTAFYRSDMQFHRELWRLTDNPFLEQTLEQTVMPLFAFFIIQ